MAQKTLSGWYCDVCEKELYWGEKVVLITGGAVVASEGGPVADSEPWRNVYHWECYEQHTCK